MLKVPPNLYKGIRQGGFTLMELLVAMVIVAILATVASFSFVGMVSSARDVRRKEDLIFLHKLLTIYYLDHGFFPTSQTAGVTPLFCKLTAFPTVECQSLLSELRSYSQKIPFDPSDTFSPGGSGCEGANCYDYITPDPAHSVSCICAQMERPTGVYKPPSCEDSNYNYCLQITY